MTITVKFFASLRESLNLSSQTLNHEGINTASDAWHKATKGAAMPHNVLIAVNMDYVKDTHKIKDGDEIAFFPPVTGG
ncbi:MAG: molybdopterin converting factor subunit 1 [Gammaproteobacteria bacterium]|nr:molybdopterin converting factor subunit 1 [Gammaproteobacteria bacterium]